MLRLFTGSDAFNHGATIRAGSSLYDPSLPAQDVTLSWATFTGAACEAGQSRVYAGIHFERADLDGRNMGAQIGSAVFDKARNYWLGRI